jgi:hypothetical protein
MDDGQEGAYGGRIHAFIRRQRQRMEAPVLEEQSAADGLLCRLSAQVRLKARINNIAAAIAASDSIKYLGKHGEILSLNRRVGIHSRSIKIEVQDLLKSEDCHVCGTA